ncbi:membrane protein DedA with SNARE-associated domain [Oikeobacillus pervagus]|uniref:Membrane protein DedA with SNARE-associated domain n=1 Tax=Oikeobacillus pervagus TaxID=1325931 RepID=A0AAJ1T1V1_9BACI|nr:DedA family protein [Oikeobacillus pervagus]MDQ0214404.1 membrane protein DedA with SNARE-associated domain [Oikeobacillus pervagus]
MEQTVYPVLEYLGSLGYIGIALALMIEVIPSEIVLSYGGYLIAKGEIGFIGALTAGVVGGTLAQVFLYWLGQYGGRPFFRKYGKWLLISEKQILASEKWFETYGPFVIFTARFIPVVRHAISIPAGFAKMPLKLFFVYTFCAMIPWTILFLLLGIELSEHWDTVEEIAGRYITPIALIAFLLLLAYLLFSFRNKKQKE